MFISKLAQELEAAIAAQHANRRQRDSVEGVVFHNRIMNHVLENHLIANLNRRFEAIIANHIAREACRRAKAIGVGQHSRLGAPTNHRTIGHFEAVGHVRARAHIENGNRHGVVGDVEHSALEKAALPAHSLARLEIDINPAMAGAEILNDFYQKIYIIILARDMMPAAEIHPFHAVNQMPKMQLEMLKRALQGIAILLAMRMEMQPAHALELAFVQLFGDDSEPAALDAWVIDGRRDFGIQRV